jgi:hypothetical protein
VGQVLATMRDDFTVMPLKTDMPESGNQCEL